MSDEIELVPMSAYETALRDRYLRSIKSLDEAKSKFNPPNFSTPEDMLGRAKESLKGSLSAEELENPEKVLSTPSQRSGSALRKSPEYFDPTQAEILKSSNVDDMGRKLEVRFTPSSYGEGGTYDYVAVAPDEKKFKQQQDWFHRSGWGKGSMEGPVPMPQADIAKLSLNGDGYVSMVRGNMQAAKEGAVDRLLMEANKDGFTPRSTNLLSAGKKMVARKAVELKEMGDEKYLQKIANFLDTGKAGKIWSTVAPIVKPLGIGLSAVGALGYSDLAGAATDLLASPIGGIAETGRDEEQKQLDLAYQRKLRSMSNKGK